jgi:signal transduction histidine kinase
MVDTAAVNGTPARSALLRDVLADRVLLSAVMVCVLLIAYQLAVTLLQPPWTLPVTGWLRTVLAWPQLLVVAWVAVSLLRTHRIGATSWCCVAVGMLSYAVARTIWTVAEVPAYPHGVPFPSLADLFFILQYLCFFTALVFSPALGRWLPNLRVMLDGLLWISAITALSWYFVFLPISHHTDLSLQAKYVSMLYQAGDLVLVYGLVVASARERRTKRAVVEMALLSVAVISLFVGDTWATLQLLHPPYTYRGGSMPDLFRFICYLLVSLAALARLRLPHAEWLLHPQIPADRLTWWDLWDGITFVLPCLAVVAAGVVIVVHAALTAPTRADLMLREAVGVALLLLATLRPAVMFLEQKQLRRERDAARARESALQIVNARMEAFLSVIAHELRTPLTSLIGNVHLMARRLDALLRPDASPKDYSRAAASLRTLVKRCEQGLQRLARLVEDVLDEARIRRGRLALHLEQCDLAAVVGEAVAQQVVLNPERSIHYVAKAGSISVMADASRIEQVVANYVSNALKFSQSDQVVEVCVRTTEWSAQVSVHDDGIGIPLAEQPHIWEQFYQAGGVAVQSGSHLGVGMGLYISKAIIEGHHGRIGMQSTPGHGSTFWFTLPLTCSSAPESPP